MRWQNRLIAEAEQRFVERVSVTIGSLRHLSSNKREGLAVALLERDAMNTSAQEYGIAEMMADLHQNPASPLTHERLFEWHPGLPRSHEVFRAHQSFASGLCHPQ